MNVYSFYVHGTVHLSNTSQINNNGVRTLHISDALCVHHQEHYKL